MVKQIYDILRSPTLFGLPLRNISFTNDRGYVPFVVIQSSHFLIHDLLPGL